MVTFPDLQATTENGVNFPADMHGKRYVCSISAEALQDHFGSRGADWLEVFQRNRSVIEAVAWQKLQSGDIQGNKILLRTADF